MAKLYYIGITVTGIVVIESIVGIAVSESVGTIVHLVLALVSRLHLHTCLDLLADRVDHVSSTRNCLRYCHGHCRKGDEYH